MILVPTFATLETRSDTAPANIQVPLKIIAYVYPPLSREIKAPAIGVPVNVAKLIMLPSTEYRNDSPEHHAHSHADLTHLIHVRQGGQTRRR